MRRQWYKPNVNYTVDEFKRDRDGCTKDKVLDEPCMKERGWIPLTSDRPTTWLIPVRDLPGHRSESLILPKT